MTTRALDLIYSVGTCQTNITDLQGLVNGCFYYSSFTTSPFSLDANRGTTVDWPVTPPQGYRVLGVIGANTNHNLSVVFTKFYTTIASNMIGVGVMNFSGTKWSDLTITARWIAVKDGVWK